MMATSTCLPEEFSCPVCLEILSDPATIPCGHTYCLKCIQKHWDKAAAKGSYSCPQCRQVFKPRPTLGRNNMLMEAMKKLKVGENTAAPVDTSSGDDGAGEAGEGDPVQGSLYPQLPSNSPKLCPLHQQVLELYCCDDKESVCDECSLLGHKGHRVVRADEVKDDKQQELEQRKTMIHNSIEARQKIIQTLPQVFQSHKDAIQSLQRETLERFAELLKNMESMSSQVVGVLQAREVSTYNQIEGHRYRLQQEISQLCRQEEELNKLMSTEDSDQFSNTLATMASVEQLENGQLEISPPEALAPGIRSALETFKEGLLNLCQENLASIFRVVNNTVMSASASNAQTSEAAPVPTSVPATKPKTTSEKTPAAKTSGNNPKVTATQSASPPHPAAASANSVKHSASFLEENPAPKTREEMLKFRFEPTLDHNTAYRHIRLSDGDRKATLRAENQNHPEHADRFVFWRQVMGREPLAGSPYYFEVEWTGQKVTIGVAYKDIGRSTSDDTSRLGHNDHSWTLYWSGTAFSVWHAGKETALAGPKARRIGVYVDQQAGLLAFYRISHNQAQQMCCVETEFSGALYPGFRFWSGVGSTITLCQLE